MRWRDWRYANRHLGEVVGRINGRRRIMRLSLSALAQLENCYGDTDILELLTRFAQQGLQADDIDNVLHAALVGARDVLAESGAPLDVEGGEAQALHLATRLIELAFAPPTPSNSTSTLSKEQ